MIREDYPPYMYVGKHKPSSFDRHHKPQTRPDPHTPWSIPTVEEVYDFTKRGWGLLGATQHARHLATILSEPRSISEFCAQDDGALLNKVGARVKHAHRPGVYRKPALSGVDEYPKTMYRARPDWNGTYTRRVTSAEEEAEAREIGWTTSRQAAEQDGYMAKKKTRGRPKSAATKALDTLKAKLKAAERELEAQVQENEDTERVNDKLSALLSGVCDALKGAPPSLMRYSYHDLPDLATALVAAMEESSLMQIRARFGVGQANAAEPASEADSATGLP
jgi:hypothetical protein